MLCCNASLCRGERLVLQALGRARIRRRVLFERMRQPLARLVGLALARPQARIEPALGQKLKMLALLDDLAAIEHDDVVGMHDR